MTGGNQKMTNNLKFDLDGYLERIHMKKPLHVNRETLDQLMFAQQSHIPYENLSIYYDTEPILLDAASLYQKMVVRRRGGYCFELNGIFIEALKRIGFTAYSCFCRVQQGASEIRPIRHRGTIVEAEGQILFCDVGYGSVLCPRSLELTADRPQRTLRGTYRFEKAGRGWWKLYYQPEKIRQENGLYEQREERVEVMCCQASAETEDFIPYNIITSTDPQSPFKRHKRAHLLTADGEIAFMDDHMTIVANGAAHVTAVKNARHEQEIFRQYFGIPEEELLALYKK